MPFCNQNGITMLTLRFLAKIEAYRSGCKKTQIFKIFLELENMRSELSKTGLRMCVRPLDRFVCSKMYYTPRLKMSKKLHFWPKITKLLKMMNMHRTLEES